MSKSVNPSESASERRTHRCAYTDKRGYRCSIALPSGDSLYCGMHAASLQRRQRAEAQKLAAELLDGCDSFASAEEIHTVLARLMRAAAEDRMPIRKSSLLLSICRSLLRAHSMVQRDLQSESEPNPNRKLNIIWGWDLPKYDSDPSPESSEPSNHRENTRENHTSASAPEPTADAYHSAYTAPGSAHTSSATSHSSPSATPANAISRPTPSDLSLSPNSESEITADDCAQESQEQFISRSALRRKPIYRAARTRLTS